MPVNEVIQHTVTPLDIEEQPENGHEGKRLGEQWDLDERTGFYHPHSELTIQKGDRGGATVHYTEIDEPSSGDYRTRELPTEKPLTFVEDGA